MIISHKHKFIFIKTVKTAGTSFEIGLSKFCGEDDIITKISRVDEEYRRELGHLGKQNYYLKPWQYKKEDIAQTILLPRFPKYINHSPATDIKRRVDPEIWNTYYKFCFERNPYDKIVSYYYWRGGDKKFGSVRNLLDSGEAGKLRAYDLYSIDGLPVVDKIFKFEDLPTAFAELNERFNFEEELKMPPKKAKGGHRPKGKHYRELIGDYERQKIEVMFAREIKLMNYEF